MKIKLSECNEISASDGVVLNDKSPVTTCDKSKQLRAAFPYIKDYVMPEVEEVLTYNQVVRLERFPITDGERSVYEKIIITPSDDLRGYSERVQTFCAIVFED